MTIHTGGGSQGSRTRPGGEGEEGRRNLCGLNDQEEFSILGSRWGLNILLASSAFQAVWLVGSTTTHPAQTCSATKVIITAVNLAVSAGPNQISLAGQAEERWSTAGCPSG